jgi:hypothetical protein
MLATAQDLSTRTVIKRLLRPVIPALAGVLVFAGTAQADLGTEGPAEGPPAATERTPEGPGTETVSGQPPAPTETPGATGAETPAAETPPPKEETPAPAETPPPAEASPPPESAPVEPQPTAGETAPPPTTESPAPDKTSETPVHASAEEHERTAESALLSAPVDGGASGGAQAESTPAASAAPAPTGSEVVKLGAQTGAAGEAPAPPAQGRTLIEQRAEQRRCALSVLGGPNTAGCAGGWMSAPGSIVSTPLGLGAVAVALGATAIGPSDQGDGGGTTDGGRPVTPSPGPAPGGAGGGVAAGGSGGAVGLSGFLTLAGLLLLAAPRALRRLRLSCRPYLTAFFVLIPERPG